MVYQEYLKSLPLEDQPFSLNQHGPIFIMGCPRSGTTFLSKCLGVIDNIEEFVGVLVPPRFMHLVGKTGDPCQKQMLLQIIQDIFWQAFWRRRYFSTEKVAQVIGGNKNSLHLLKKSSLENILFLYKEPFLCFAAQDFFDFFPNAKFIHIIRDGRDNADSLERGYPDALSDKVLSNEFLALNKNSEIGFFREYAGQFVPWWVKNGEEDVFLKSPRYARCILLWKEMVIRGRSLNKYGDERYLEIRYEDFVRYPFEKSELILNYLGFELNTKMSRKLRQAFPRSIGISKKNQNKETLDLAYKFAGDLLEDLGYSA